MLNFPSPNRHLLTDDQAATISSATGSRILVVDDEPGIRTLLSRLLSRRGYRVDLAEDGYDAWGYLNKRPYAALIVDLKMPGSSGQELYAHLQAMNPALAHRMIFISGDVVGHESREFVATTGNPLLDKPFDVAELLRQLESLVKARSQEVTDS